MPTEIYYGIKNKKTRELLKHKVILTRNAPILFENYANAEQDRTTNLKCTGVDIEDYEVVPIRVEEVVRENKVIAAKIVDFPEYDEKTWTKSQWEYFKNKGHITVELTDGENTVFAYFENMEQISKYGGIDEIHKYASFQYSNFLEKWMVFFDFSSWANSAENNPHKIIELDYVGEKNGTNETIFKKRGETRKNSFILRQNGNQNFKPVYLTATKVTDRDGVWLEGDCPLRPNIEIKAYDEKGGLLYHEITKALSGGEIIAEPKTE